MKTSQQEQFEHALGTFRETTEPERKSQRDRLLRYTKLKLMSHGLPMGQEGPRAEFDELITGLLDSYREKTRLLDDYRCPADQRIESFLGSHLDDLNLPFELRLPGHALVLDRHGIARELSLPLDRDEFASEYVQSYRVKNGVLHNPRHDRRTTKGTFPRIPAICRTGPTRAGRGCATSSNGECALRAGCRKISRSKLPSCQSYGGDAIILPTMPPVSAIWPFTIRFIIRSFPSCSWTSSAP